MTSTNGLPTIKTFTGLTFDYLNPMPSMIDLRDIAHALSNICRFGGQAKDFYSVAQHSILVSIILLRQGHDNLRFAGLMHDATESYVGDVVKPLKNLLPEYEAIEDRVWAVIAEKFTLPVRLPRAVKAADRTALAIEGSRFMAGREDEYGFFGSLPDWAEGLRDAWEPWPPKRAEKEFLDLATLLIATA